MTTGNKRWWRMVAVAVVTGGAIGSWFGLARSQPAVADKGPSDETDWARPTTVAAPLPPTVAEAPPAPDLAPPTGPIVPVGGRLPIPVPNESGPVVPAAPLTPPIPTAPPVLPVIEPVAGPRIPDAGLIGDKVALPPVPAVPAVPALPSGDAPVPPPFPGGIVPVSAPVSGPDSTPRSPSLPPGAIDPLKGPLPTPPAPPAPPITLVPPTPVIPPPPTGFASGAMPLQPGTTEPPKAAPLPQPTPLPLPTPVMPPVDMGPNPALTPVAPVVPVVSQPANLTPTPSPINPTAPAQPILPAKPEYDLKPTVPPNTLNPTVSPVAPAVPIAPGRETPAAPVDRPKPPEPNFGSTEKFVFPIPAKPATPEPVVPTPRDDTMYKLTTSAALAVLGGAMLAVEKANAFPTVPPSAIIPMPGMLVKADEKTDTVEALKKDLKDAKEKIAALEDQVKKLNELLTGKRDSKGNLIDPAAPGEVAKLKDDIYKLENELKDLKRTQTVQKPALGVLDPKPKGIVKVVNEYQREIAMVINDKSYRIAPASKIEVEVPAGEFTYQLLESGAASTRSVIKDKEAVTLRIK